MRVRDYLKSHTTVFIFCLAGGYLLPLVSCQVCMESLSRYLASGTFSFAIWLSMWLGNEAISHYLDHKIPWTSHPVTRLSVGIVAVLVYTLTTMIILVALFEWAVNFRFSDSYGSVIYPTIIVTFVITTVLTSRTFLLNWRQLAINAAKLEKEGIEAKYETLKNQVNPHFLFNSLNALTNLVYEDPDKAVKFIRQLSQVYRYVLDTRDKEIVPLEDEVNFLKSYAYLQQIRFGEKLRIVVDLDLAGSMVAPLCLQMLVENCIKHNVVSEESPLHISITADDEYISVENMIHRKMHSVEPSPGVGLENIKMRYSFLHDKPVQVIEEKGRFRVRLPLLKPEVNPAVNPINAT